MKTKYCGGLVLLTLLSLMIGCQPPSSPPAASPTAAIVETVKPKPAGEEAWNKIIVEAKKEGAVVIYYAGPLEVRAALTEAFKKKYDIDLSFVVGRGAELTPKIEQERKAGLYLVDVGIIGWSTYVNPIKGMKVTDPIEPLIVLPEVKDASKWFQGRLSFMDKEGHALALILRTSGAHIYNTDLVKKGEVSGTLDFLNPKWKGKMVMMDPSTGGPGVNWYQHTLINILGMDKGRAYMRDLAKSIDIFTRDFRQHTEWVARGKYPVGLAIRTDEPLEFLQAGAPIDFVDSDEPRRTAPGWGLLNVFKNRPHPNASQLFVNWLLTQEGFSEFIRANPQPTPRLDISTKGIHPILLPRPKDMTSTEELETGAPEMIRMAKEDFAILLK